MGECWDQTINNTLAGEGKVTTGKTGKSSHSWARRSRLGQRRYPSDRESNGGSAANPVGTIVPYVSGISLKSHLQLEAYTHTAFAREPCGSEGPHRKSIMKYGKPLYLE